MPQPNKNLISLIFCSLVVSSFASLTLHLPNGTDINYETAQLFYDGYPNPFPSYSGEMISENNDDLSLFSGRIVYWRTGTPPEPKIRYFMKLGVLGIVMGSGWKTPGRHMFLIDGSGSSDFIIPISQMKRREWLEVEEFFTEMPFINVTITSEEGNQWRDLFEGVGMLVGQIIMSAATLFAVILAAYKLHLYRIYGETGLRWNVSQVTLWLEIISNSLRFLHVAVDPLGCRKVLTYFGHNSLERMSLPFTLAASLLIVFFWYELMKKPTGKIHSFLYKLKIPFYILIGVLLALQAITVSVAVTTWTSFQMDLLIIILYVILTSFIMVFYLITGVRLLKHLKPNENKVDVNNNSKHLLQTTRLLLGSAGCLFAFVVIEIVHVSMDLSAEEYVLFFFLYYGALTAASITQILAFQPELLVESKSNETSP